jgi:hypothetical protein
MLTSCVILRGFIGKTSIPDAIEDLLSTSL